MSRTNLEGLLASLNSYVEQDCMGLNKVANVTEKDILDGDRTETSGSGTTHSAPDKEMNKSIFKDKPIEESYDPEKEKDKMLEEKRLREAMRVGEKSIDTSFSNNEPSSSDASIVNPKSDKEKVEKSAALANHILEEFRKEAEEEASNEPDEKKKSEDKIDEEEKKQEKEKEKKEEYENMDYVTSKEAGYKEFEAALDKEGSNFLVKVASCVDPEFVARVEFSQGAHLADIAIEKVASLQMEKVASDEQRSYNLGQELAQKTITKLAADIVAVRPIVQDLVAKQLLSEEERDALVDALASADVLTPEVAQAATQGLANADQVAASLIKAIEGTQGANVVPPPAVVPMPTAEALPGKTPTVDSAPPETATIDIKPEGIEPVIEGEGPDLALEQKAEELLAAVREAAVEKPEMTDSEEKELVIQAALNVLAKKKKKCK